MKNYKMIYLILFFCLAFSSKVFSEKYYNLTTDTVKEIRNLKMFYLKGFKTKAIDSSIYQVKFFYEFPNSFKNFYEVYYWNEKNDTPAPLYLVAKEHIDAFFNLKTVNTSNKINKIIEISLNGKWDSDAISYFQHDLHSFLLNNKIAFINALKKRNATQINSFWFFYFDYTQGHYLDDSYNEIKTGFPEQYKDFLAIIHKAYIQAKRNNKN